MSATPGRILVIRGGAIGDFVLTLPVLAALRTQFPRARLEVLGYPHIAQLALAGGLADALRPIEARPLAGFFARGGALDPEWRDYFAGFQIILSYLYDPDEIFQASVRQCGKAQFLAAPHRPDDAAGRHATEVFLQPLERLAIFGPDPVPRLPISSTSPAGNLIAAHPGSGSPRKNWPLEKWEALLKNLLRDPARQFLLVGGEADLPAMEHLVRVLPAAQIELALRLPLAELAARLAGCRAFIGHDSGVSHLAAAVGRPGLVLWGDTVEAVWRPRGDGVKILRAASGLATLPVERVREELVALDGGR